MKRVIGYLMLMASVAWAAAPGFDTAKIEQLTGLKGVLNEKDGVFKVSYPRSDLHVMSNGVTITPPMGLTAWAAFTRMGDHDMVMGDIVMTEDQVNPVMSAALDNGLDVTALHNHFFWDQPKIMFMHISGMMDEGTLVTAVGKVFAKLKETQGGKGETVHADLDPAKTTLDPKIIEDIFGAKGDFKQGVYKWTWGKITKMGGQDMGNAMGVNTWAAFNGTDEKALVDGDVAMYESEVTDVLKSLRHSHFNIVAIHNHMTMEEPRVIFLHFWAVGPTTDLAKGLKAALDTQKKGGHMNKKIMLVMVLGLSAIVSHRSCSAEPMGTQVDAKLFSGIEAAKVSLKQGLSASEAKGKPISGKFELEDGKLQLSVYTAAGDQYSEVVVDQNTGKIVKAEPITSGDDLASAKAQSADMAGEKVSLKAALGKALKENTGFRAISIVPSLKDGQPVAITTLSDGKVVKTISEKLN